MAEYQDILIRSSPEFIVAVGVDGKVMMMNDSMLKSLGYSIGDAMGLDFKRYFFPDESRVALSAHRFPPGIPQDQSHRVLLV